MERYKICPNCKTQNEPDSIECIECEEDLTSVKISTKEAVESNDITHIESNVQMCKVCSCGEKNPPNARKCTKCSADLTFVPITKDDNAKTTKFFLQSVDGKYTLQLTEGISVIGRENLMSEYLLEKSYVSRKHAEIEIIDKLVKITNFGINYTFVNNENIGGKTVELQNGDSLSFGGKETNGKKDVEAAYFVLRVE